MASPYPAYSSREPSSNIHYANINPAPVSYPYPPHNHYDPSSSSLDSDFDAEPDKGGGIKQLDNAQTLAVADARTINRTPSPTPSEAKELAKTSVFDWEAMLKWKYWFRKDWIWYYVAFIVCLAGVILFTVYHKQIVQWLRPAADWMHDLPFGWTIPIAVLFVISFPPLFGHEIVAILCGLVWGLGPGFGIVAAGTFLGELGNFYARGEKLEKSKLSYACLAHVVREGGFKIALIARLSAIPGHFTTAVFSTCGMGVFTFSLAAILSLPKQFITVYLGVALEQSEDGSGSTTDTIIKDVVLGATTLITIGAMWYIYHQMNKVKPHVIYERRKARQAKLALSSAATTPYANPAVLESTTEVAFNPAASGTDIPLTKYAQAQPQQEYDYSVYAPQPRRPQQAPTPDQYTMSERGYSPNAPSLPPGAGYPYQHLVQPSGPVMSQSRDPFSDTTRAPSQQQGASYQRQAPQRGYGSPPPESFAGVGANGRRSAGRREVRSPPGSQPRTSTNPHQQSQPQTGYLTSSAQVPPPLPSMGGHIQANPFSDPMPNPYEVGASGGGSRNGYGQEISEKEKIREREKREQEQYGHAHGVEPSDATFYTAVGGARSREGTEGHEPSSDGDGPPPPSYQPLSEAR